MTTHCDTPRHTTGGTCYTRRCPLTPTLLGLAATVATRRGLLWLYLLLSYHAATVATLTYNLRACSSADTDKTPTAAPRLQPNYLVTWPPTCTPTCLPTCNPMCLFDPPATLCAEPPATTRAYLTRRARSGTTLGPMARAASGARAGAGAGPRRTEGVLARGRGRRRRRRWRRGC